MEPPDEQKKRALAEPSLWSRVTYSWVAERLSSTNNQSRDGLVRGQRSAWLNFRNLRHAWNKHARSAHINKKDPRLWRAVASFALTEDFTQLLLWPSFIVCTRFLQPVMFAAVFSFHPFLLYDSPVPWICAAIAGFWLAVFLEGLARSHYAFFAHLTSASVKSGLTGLVHEKVNAHT